MLIDTDVLVWVFRGHANAANAVDDDDDRMVSIVTYMELMQGARDKGEMRSIKQFLTDMGFMMLPLAENIGHRASVYLEEYALQVAMSMGDALIAATAVEHGHVLLTANRKHYRPINDLEIKLFRP